MTLIKGNDMIREKNCFVCGNSFSYTIGRGTDRKHCSEKCREKHKLVLRDIKFRLLPNCSVDGCTNKANRTKYGLCETHYYRIRRTGSTDDKIFSGRYKTSAGYIKVLMPGHDLSNKDGHVYEHRMVAYNKENGVCPSCHWCGDVIEWKNAVIDHLNENKEDNREDNLAVTCNTCNRARGSILPMIKRLKHDSLEQFITLIRDYHSYISKEIISNV